MRELSICGRGGEGKEEAEGEEKEKLRRKWPPGCVSDMAGMCVAGGMPCLWL